MKVMRYFLNLDPIVSRSSSNLFSCLFKGEVPDIKRMKHINLINKKKKSKLRKMEKAMVTVRKKEKNKNKAESFNFSALHLLNDPQGMRRLQKFILSNDINFPFLISYYN